MEDLLIALAMLVHLTLLFVIPIHLIRSLWSNRRKEKKFKKIHLMIEISLMILLIFCFLYVDMSNFHDNKYYLEFASLLSISVLFYWINKIDFANREKLRKFTLPFTGTLFWLSSLTAVKFVIYLPFCWFPLLGLMAIAPILFGLMSLSEILFHTQLKPKNAVNKLLLSGLIPILIVQLVMNLYTPEAWEFFKMFNPNQ